MSASLAAGGWVLAAALALVLLRLRRRLELVARAEHELRGPVTVLLLVAERCGGHDLGVELERLEMALADLAAARRGRRAKPREALVALEPIGRDALDAWAPALRERGREASVDWRAAGATVRAGPGRVAQALANLVANAVEHGDGPVELLGRRTPAGVRVEVRNGASAGERPRLEGRGRGLPIAAAAAEEAGGRLRFESRDGTAVASLELPAGEPPPGG